MSLRALAASVAGLAGSALYQSSQVSAAPAPGPFDPTAFKEFDVISAYDESHDTRVIRFALPEADMKCNLACASCVVLMTEGKDGKAVVRPYTPISRVDQTGYFEIMIKKYKDSQMGTYTHGLKRGDKVKVKGPFVKIPIKSNQYRSIGMIAGGTGIAPMYQVAQEVLRDPKNKTDVSLIYSNRRKEDVLLGNELNELMMLHPKFSPYFVLSKPPSNWMGGIGRVNKEMIKSFLPAPDKAAESIVLVSGPPGFMESISGDKDFKKSPPAQGELAGMLKEMGYTSKQVFKF